VSENSLRFFRSAVISATIFLIGADTRLLAQSETSTSNVVSKDGTPIAVEYAGTGPSLVIVHGGIGDHTRWKPLFPFLAPHFTVCAMDRRGHGASGDSADYSLRKEAEDVAAVVDSRPPPIFVLGHSYGGLCALEATFIAKNISKLVLYEPAVQERDRSAIASKMETLVRAKKREQALIVFLQEIVMISPEEIAAMRSRPNWTELVANVDSQIRQLRALDAYHFDPKRISDLSIPTLLLTGSKTASPYLKRGIDGLMAALPNRRLIVLEGQEHNAMEAIPEKFAATVSNFLLETDSNRD
jgi:pimeloyl-ACP methyl ester carboxylesterase